MLILEQLLLGSKGSIVFEKKVEYHIDPIMLKKLVDTTGAGDLFASGFCLVLLINTQLKNVDI